MEKQIALINKENQRVINVLVVDSLDKFHIDQWATDELDVIAVKDSIPYVNGLWNGKEFTPPNNEYLKEIGLMTAINEELKAEAEAKAQAKAAAEGKLAALGLTTDDLRALGL
jgi:hypothetical protein